MKTRFSLFASPVLVLTLITTGLGQAVDDNAIQRAATETLLAMPEPPLGYAVNKLPIVVNDQLTGFKVQVVQEDAVSKVFIMVDLRDLSDRDTRVTACKAYANATADILLENGFKITSRQAPDIEKADFKTPIVVDLSFANDEGATIFVSKRMFFTKRGYDVTVIATDSDDLKMLTNWATKISPAATPSE
jgi:hypothetical protein